MIRGMKINILVLTLAAAVLVSAPVARADFQAGLAAYQQQQYATAWREWTPIAEAGDPIAQNGLGVMAFSGYGVPQDHALAAQWFERAALQGLTDAQYNLAIMYQQGLGVTQNAAQARAWFELAAAQGHEQAAASLAATPPEPAVRRAPTSRTSVRPVSAQQAAFDRGMAAYRQGDFDGALREWQPLAERGMARAQNNLGVMYDKGQGVARDARTAVSWFSRSAEGGMAAGQANLSVMFANGDGVPQDDREALAWAARAAERGYAPAQFDLARIFEQGRGTAADPAQAARWYQQAANQGHTQAQYQLALAYERGSGVAKDSGAALSWLQQSADGGYAPAQFALAVRLENGDGVATDPAGAVSLFRRAAEQGLAEAQHNLGLALSDVGDREAVTWLRRAADQGLVPAQAKLGALYAAGNGVVQDGGSAVRWLTAAADAGDVSAQYNLGVLYATGPIASRNLPRAAAWYEKAAAQQLAEAQYSLAVLYDTGQGVAQDPDQATQYYRQAATQGYAGPPSALARVGVTGTTAPDVASGTSGTGTVTADSGIDLTDILARAITRDDVGVATTGPAPGSEDQLAALEPSTAPATPPTLPDTALAFDGPLPQVPPARFDTGLSASQRGDYLIAFTQWLPLAEAGFAKAQFNVGELYHQGQGVAADDAESTRWYELAAAQGHAGASARLDELQQPETVVTPPLQIEAPAPVDVATTVETPAPVETVETPAPVEIAETPAPVEIEIAPAAEPEAAEPDAADIALPGASATIEIAALPAASTADSRTRADALVAAASPDSVTSEIFDAGYDAYRAGDPGLAATLWRQLAEEGLVNAQYNLALMSLRGDGLERDPDQAMDWMRRTARKGDPQAQFALGLLLDRGFGVPRGADEAVSWYRRAADAGHVAAQTQLGVAYYEGLGVPRDLSVAVQWYRQAARELSQRPYSETLVDSPEFSVFDAPEPAGWLKRIVGLARRGESYEAGLAAFQRGDYGGALSQWSTLASDGDVRSQSKMSILYATGRGVPRDAREARRWAEAAIEQGSVEGMFVMGQLIATGAVAGSDSDALAWFQRAAELGHAPAQGKLGVRTILGRGIDPDVDQGLIWLTEAAQAGASDALTNLGLIYLTGFDGVPKDTQVAVTSLEAAAAAGNRVAQYNLGAMYANGDGLPQDSGKAQELFAAAAEQGLRQAQFALGLMFSGDGAQADFARANRWFRAAAGSTNPTEFALRTNPS